jgi:hypothetical protein
MEQRLVSELRVNRDLIGALSNPDLLEDQSSDIRAAVRRDGVSAHGIPQRMVLARME